MSAYYNENDPFAAAWLRELIADGLIADGDVDERSILDVSADDLVGYDQYHWFAGIGGWSHALRLAGWPDDREVWTGSCPCQPLSSAGQRKGPADKRHIWPAFHTLIAECQPATVFGEQVASKLGREWFAGVRADLESLGYAVGAADLPAASVGAPHIRQRLWWLADAQRSRWDWRSADKPGGSTTPQETGAHAEPRRRGDASGGMADAINTGSQGRLRGRSDQERQDIDGHAGRGGADFGMGDADSGGRKGRGQQEHGEQQSPRGTQLDGSGAGGFWQGTYIPCADGKARLIEPSIFPLAHGVPNRVGTLRGAGNAIAPQVAAEFVRAYDAT